MATEEVGIRLSLQGRREAAAGLSDTKRELEAVAETAQDVGAAGNDAARGLDKATDKKFANGFANIRTKAAGVAGVLGRGLVRGAKVAGVALGATAIAAGGLSVQAISLAGDANETGSAFATVLGPSARGVQKDLDKLNHRFGIYSADLQQAATGFATLGKQAGESRKGLTGFSTDLVRAGLDLGSFYNASPEDAFKAIQSGLTGEAESLKRFNIFMSDAALNAFALKKGLGETTQEMTEQEKVALRQAFIMANLGDAQGDLARTSAGFANQQRGVTGRTQELLRTLGGPLTTAATGAFRGLNFVLKAAMSELQDRLPQVEGGAQRLSRRFAQLGKTWAQDLPGAIDTLTGRWDSMTSSFDSFNASGGGAQLGTLKDNIVALGPGLRDAATQLPGLSDTLAVTNVVTGYLAENIDLLAKYMPWLVAGFVALKVSQLAANIVLAASLPMKIAELVTNRQLTASNKALVASRTQVTAATAASTVATGANTAAENTGILARARSVVGMVVHRGAMIAGAAASGVVTAATWAWNAALSANPIGIVVIAIAGLVAGLVLAYNKSETFRGIVDKLWAALKTAGKWVADLAVKAGTFIAKWTPLGMAVTVVRDKFDSVGDAVGAVIGKLQEAWDWIGKVAGAAADIPGVGLIGDAVGGIGGMIPGFATGGAVAAGRAITVGERGRETFLPTVPGVVLPNLTTTPDVDEMFGDDGPAAPPVVHVYLDGEEVTSRVVTRLETRVAFG